jgi:hypothetical protein
VPVVKAHNLKGSGPKGAVLFSDLREYVAVLQEADAPGDWTFDCDWRFRSSRMIRLTLKPPLSDGKSTSSDT